MRIFHTRGKPVAEIVPGSKQSFNASAFVRELINIRKEIANDPSVIKNAFSMKSRKWFGVVPRDNVPGPFMNVDDVDFCGFDARRLYHGETITDWPSKITYAATEYTPGERADDALVTFNMVPVYSARLQQAILAAGITDFQFLPCQVVNGLGKQIPGYAVANVLTIRDAFAPDHAKVLYQDPNLRPVFTKWNIKVIYQYALFAERLAGCHVLRLLQYRPVAFVSQTFKRAYSSIKATGISFRAAKVVAESCESLNERTNI